MSSGVMRSVQFDLRISVLNTNAFCSLLPGTNATKLNALSYDLNIILQIHDLFNKMKEHVLLRNTLLPLI